MHELEITWSRVMSIWWLLMWRTLLGGALAGAILGFKIGFVGALLRYPPGSTTPLSAIVGGLAGLCWGIVVIRMALKKNYSGFRIALVTNS
jgi:hypothetical protein